MKQLPKQTYLEVSFTGGEDDLKKAEVRDFLIGQRIAPFAIAEGNIRNKFTLSVYVKSAARSTQLLKAFAAAKISRLKTKVKRLGPKAWLEKWHEDYHTQSLSRKFDVGPIWEKSLYQKKRGKQAIFLDPKCAFGSGVHETTKLMARLIETRRGQFRNYLDLGTGTGILAVAASKLGAGKVFGIDIDGPSVREASRNMTLNGFKKGKFKRKDLLTFKHRKKYELVGANLFSKLLIAQQRKIRSFVGVGGSLVVSGIMRRSEKEFLKEFKHPSFKKIVVLRGRRWIAVLYLRVGDDTRRTFYAR